MDVSPVQSGAKSGSSDFSIERILSDEPRSVRQATDSPSWLCCSRYRPPKLPRTSTSLSRSRRSGRHARVPFTAAQASALEAAYTRAPYMAPPALRALAAALQLRDDRIKIWFQNRRARERRERSTVISPPLAVTLPATRAHHASMSHTNIWTDHVKLTPGHSVDLESKASFYNNSEDESSSSFKPGDDIEELSDSRSETPLDIETVDE